jgi:hypothetical protein
MREWICFKSGCSIYLTPQISLFLAKCTGVPCKLTYSDEYKSLTKLISLAKLKKYSNYHLIYAKFSKENIGNLGFM